MSITSSIIQPFWYLLIIPFFYTMKILFKYINDLFSYLLQLIYLLNGGFRFVLDLQLSTKRPHGTPDTTTTKIQPILVPICPTPLQNESDTQFCLAAVPSNERLVYVKQTFSTNCTLKRASRLHQMHILKIKCRLVHTKCMFFCKKDVSPTPNTYFGQRIVASGAIEDGDLWANNCKCIL